MLRIATAGASNCVVRCVSPNVQSNAPARSAFVKRMVREFHACWPTTDLSATDLLGGQAGQQMP